MALANGDRHTHDTHTRLGATVAFSSSSSSCVSPAATALSMKDFRKLVKEGAGLRLRTDTERHLKQSVTKVNFMHHQGDASDEKHTHPLAPTPHHPL